MMRLLLTGFEPFGSSVLNPSEEVVRAFAADRALTPAGVELATLVLPVEHLRGPAALLEKLQTFDPAAVISLGEARGRCGVSFEQIAINWIDYQMPDNVGTIIADEPIVPNGPAAYFSTLPLKGMIEAVRAEGIAAELSRDAGVCLCNEIMYHCLHQRAQTRQAKIPAGFIHLPWLPAQVAHQQQTSPTSVRALPSMHLDDLLRAIRSTIEVLRNDDSQA